MLLYCRLPGDKIDVWLCRYNGLGPANFWGFKQLSYRYRLSDMRACSAVWHLAKLTQPSRPDPACNREAVLS